MVRLSLICGLLCDLIRLLLRLNSFISRWFHALTDLPLILSLSRERFSLRFFDPVKSIGAREALTTCHIRAPLLRKARTGREVSPSTHGRFGQGFLWL